MSMLYSQLFVTPKYPTSSFEGQTVIVTGSNTGLGKEAARHFARLGAEKVVMACRNTAAGEEARKDILDSTKRDPSAVEVWHLNLSSIKSIESFASRASSELGRIDVLLENAGIAPQTHVLNEEFGFESTITVNVIATFLLGLLLLPKLKSTAELHNPKPRWCIVSSEVHAWVGPEAWTVEPVDVFGRLNETPIKGQYPRSKLLEILVVRAIAPMMEGSGVVLNLLNPGFCHSQLARDLNSWYFTVYKTLLARSTEVGSRTLLAAASAGPDSHGKYMSDGIVNEDRLSDFVRSEAGTKASNAAWAQLKVILEKIHPGVTDNL